ncbi:MAG TPA: hypothetical protein VKE53_01995 [Pseudolabrys sp.]|jgi:hypothetical protein|nr:hypothetical protein [Pseudolabrys sp.]
MPALLPILFTASHVVLAADSVPKFDVERTCRPAAAAATLPGRDSSACQRDEQTARSRLESDWSQYTTAQRRHCTGFAALDRAPSYVELLTCLEMAKQVKELPEESKMGTVGRR